MSRVGIDVDDVIYPWYDTAHAICKREGLAGDVDPRTWRVHEEYGVTLEEWVAVLEANNEELYSAPPLPGAVESVQRLKDAGHSIHVVTARGHFAGGDYIKQATVRWLADWKIPYDTLTFATDKTLVRVDWFADDREQHVIDMRNAGVPHAYVIDRPWSNTGGQFHSLWMEDIVRFTDRVLEGCSYCDAV